MFQELLVHFRQRLARYHAAHDVDQNVNRVAECAAGLGHQLLDVPAPGHISGDCGRGSARLPNALDRLLSGRGVMKIVDGHAGASLGQGQRHGPADVPGASGDDCYLAFHTCFPQ